MTTAPIYKCADLIGHRLTAFCFGNNSLVAADQTLPLSVRGVDWETNYKGGRNNQTLSITVEGSATARLGVRDFKIHCISRGFQISDWILYFTQISGFLDFKVDFRISKWISEFQSGFQDFKVDF